MRLNDKSLVLKNPKILKFPNINYNLSNAPYHEIIDTAITCDKIKTEKEKFNKYKRMIKLTMNLLIGTKIAKELENKNTSLIIPDFKDNNNIIEVMTLLEAQINILIDDMKSNIEKEAEIAINELIK